MWLLGVFLVLQVLDGVLTYMGTQRWGTMMEGNPLIQMLFNWIGVVPALICAKVFAGGCGLLLYLQGGRRALLFVNVFYFFIAVLPWAFALYFLR